MKSNVHRIFPLCLLRKRTEIHNGEFWLFIQYNTMGNVVRSSPNDRALLCGRRHDIRGKNHRSFIEGAPVAERESRFTGLLVSWINTNVQVFDGIL